MINAILNEDRFKNISEKDKEFIVEFTDFMDTLDYDFGNAITDGYCWGEHMIVYAKRNVKSKKVLARIYFRGNTIVLRLFLNDIDKHREFIENSPEHIKEPFIGNHCDCQYCKNDKNGNCKFRKSYTIEGKKIEKCNGVTFEFANPNISKLSDYKNLIKEFSLPKSKK